VRGLWLVVAILGLTTVLLTSRHQLPAAPVFVLSMAIIGGGLWWLAQHGGRASDRPVAAPMEALVLVGATLAALVAFWLLWDALS
jgi:hypothetical protein